MRRVFISAPGDLDAEREACRAVISEVNQESAMPSKILLVSVGLVNDDHIVGYRSAVSQNIRDSTFYIQFFEDDWGPKNLFRKMFLLAAECRGDASLPMRDVIVCLKDAPHETDAETLAFRKELEARPDMRIVRFSTLESLRAELTAICAGWVDAIRESAAAAG